MTDNLLTAESPALDQRTSFGFWVYLMTDCLLFASLFATYAVLRGATYGGPGPHQLFDPGFVLIETLILLTSSFSCGMAIVAARRGNKNLAFALLGLTFVLGVAFLTMEISEFTHLALSGEGWTHSAFLSAFFTLVGTHGLHIAVGLVWLTTLLAQTAKWGLVPGMLRRLSVFGLFWHFLDIIWIFIFTIVYLWGIA